LTQTQIEIPRWTAPEFERLVFASNPKVAVFDCDGTLWNGDSGFGFMEWSLKKDMFSRSAKDRLDLRNQAYMAGKVSEPDICAEMMSSAVMSVGGEKSEKKAWERVFKNFNDTHGFGNNGYKAGEKIAIKVNFNNDRSNTQPWWPGWAYPASTDP